MQEKKLLMSYTIGIRTWSKRDVSRDIVERQEWCGSSTVDGWRLKIEDFDIGQRLRLFISWKFSR